MSNSEVIQTSQSADLVTHKILIEGEELSKTYQVKNIVVQNEVNRIPIAQIILIDGDPAARDFKLSNEELLIPGKKIQINAGYHNDEEVLYKGIIIKHSIKIKDKLSLLIIECKDEIVKLTIGRKNNYFYDVKDSEVFEEIIGNYGLENDIEATNFTHKELVQFAASDWDFIVTRAQACGKLCFVENGKITIKKPDTTAEPVETVTFGSTLLDFDAEIDARNQFSKISSYSWDYANQEIVEIEANKSNMGLNGNLSSSDLAEIIQLDNFELRHGGNLTETELQDWADATMLFQELSKIRGRAKFQGVPTVKPNTIITLEGVGERFNGKAYITGVSHQITEGNWTIDAQFGLNPEWFSETYDVSAPEASGIIPAIKGLHIGIVSQLEEDPNGEDRILVKIPIINNEQQGIWCRVASIDAGENRGVFFRPEIEDEVVIGFINEDPNNAIVLGTLHSSSKPAPIVASDDNHQKGIVTRSEMKLLFDDEKKSIGIETPAGKKITIDEDQGVIAIEDENSNVITIDSAGIKMESAGNIELIATGDVSIEGTNVTVKANAQFKAEGSGGAEVSSSGTAVLKGSIVQIN